MTSSSPTRASSRTLALAWAAVVAMWVLAYVALLQPGTIVGEVLFGLMLLCPAIAGFVAGRHEAVRHPPGAWTKMIRAVIAAAMVGLVIAVVNLLIVGSLLVDPVSHQFRPNAIWWIVGDLVITIGSAKIGGMLGAVRTTAAPQVADLRRDWFSLFTRVAAVAVFLLLITGGLVTGLKAGMAVADWPTSFGHNMLLYPLSEMMNPLQRSQGVHYEHAHRLYGMLVGLTSITLAAALWIYDRRTRVCLFGMLILAMVCVQGYMGGKRVTETSTTLAIVHGIFAQVVFACVVAVAAMTSPAWRASSPSPSLRPGAGKTDRTATMVLLILLVLQLALGALYRHLRRQADEPGAAMHVLLTHIVVALLVAGAVIFAGGRAWAFRRDQPMLVRVGKGTTHAMLTQLALGIIAAVLVLQGKDSQAGPIEIVLTTAHQAVGALLLAMATLLALWTRRLPPYVPAAPSSMSASG